MLLTWMPVLSPSSVASAASSSYISAGHLAPGGGGEEARAVCVCVCGGEPAFAPIGGEPEVRSSLGDHAHH